MNMKEIINESLRYWEARRPVYNAVLALVAVGAYWVHRSSGGMLTWPALAGLLLAAVIANVLYCAAYAVDFWLQISDFQTVWKRWRWTLFVLGTLLAAGIFLVHE
jgi:hypothetical protein